MTRWLPELHRTALSKCAAALPHVGLDNTLGLNILKSSSVSPSVHQSRRCVFRYPSYYRACGRFSNQRRERVTTSFSSIELCRSWVVLTSAAIVTMSLHAQSASVASCSVTLAHAPARTPKMMRTISWIFGKQGPLAYSSIDLRFTTTTNAMALALKQQGIRERSVMVEDVEIRTLTESLAGGMRIKIEDDIDGLDGTPRLSTIAETEPTASEEYPSSVITTYPEALLLSDSDGEHPTQSKDLQYEQIYYPEMDSAPTHEISRPMAVAAPLESDHGEANRPRSP